MEMIFKAENIREERIVIMKKASFSIDGKNANTALNMRFRGVGMVTGNNSSRLLLDYKSEHPDRYNEILEYTFGKHGIGVNFLKLEMGSDVNSSSGTEPCVKRYEDEKADVTRGAGYQLAADAKKINPDLELDMLWWSEPLWVTKADDVHAARYKWYKETLDAAKKLAAEYGKELWFSEGSPSMSYSQGTYRFDGNGSGLGDLNGVLDIANRLIMMYASGKMTMCELQPVIAAYYDGVCYCQKQFISACDPWSGYYYLDSGFFMSLHFSQFIKRGWTYIDGACHADAKTGGDGHALVDSVFSYITACDPDSGDYSTVITNSTSEPIVYDITVSDLAKASSDIDVWETRGPDNGSYDENYFKEIDTITPTESGGKYSYTVTVKPFSMITLSTVKAVNDFVNMSESERTVLALPYSDDFDYGEEFLRARGGAPKFTTDEGGAFEVECIGGRNVLVQQITPETKAEEWGYTPNPTTNFGDDRWYNYSVSAEVKLCESAEPDKNYAGIGLRYNEGHKGESGYWLKLSENGTYSLMKNKKVLESGSCKANVHDFTPLKISVQDGNIKCFIGGKNVIDFTDKCVQSAGRAAFYSSFDRNMFAHLLIEPNENCYVTRYDNTDLCCDYSGAWEHITTGSFANYKRTLSNGSAGAVMTVKFSGNGFAVVGENKQNAVINVKIDGKTSAEGFFVPECEARDIAYGIDGLADGLHTVEIEVVSGIFSADSVQFTGGNVPFSVK